MCSGPVRLSLNDGSGKRTEMHFLLLARGGTALSSHASALGASIRNCFISRDAVGSVNVLSQIALSLLPNLTHKPY